MRACLAVLLFCFAVPAFAQEAGQPTRLYINQTTLVTASRLIGLGGASVGLGENSESLPFNYAAAGNRSPRRTRQWDWDFTFSVLATPFVAMRDVDNDASPPDQYNSAEFQVGGMVQIKRVGVGFYLRTSNRSICDTPPCADPERLTVGTTQGAVVIGFNLWEDQLAFGVGLNLAAAGLTLTDQRADYLGWGLGAGVLYRPHFLPFRIGLSGVSTTAGGPRFDLATQPNFAGRPTFREVVTPGRVSVGLTWRLGDGAWRYNRLSPPAVRAMMPGVEPGDVPHDIDDDPRSPGQWLLSAQLDLIFAVQGATNAHSFLANDGVRQKMGEGVYLVPRAGAEYEPLENRLRLRAGFYLEPPFLEGSSVRPHGTLGAEVFLFDVLFPWSLSVAMDVAPRYMSFGLGIGWWNAG